MDPMITNDHGDQGVSSLLGVLVHLFDQPGGGLSRHSKMGEKQPNVDMACESNSVPLKKLKKRMPLTEVKPFSHPVFVGAALLHIRLVGVEDLQQ